MKNHKLSNWCKFLKRIFCKGTLTKNLRITWSTNVQTSFFSSVNQIY
jgi:hypothetical protein